ncbi:MAG: DUF5946 family protein [Bacteroidota bacterium]
MQDFIDQARKNGVILEHTGNCQLCGAAYEGGIFECMDHYNKGTELLDFADIENHLYRFLSVDAHALQHPEIHGRWSNHFHLTRLYLLFEKKVVWNYQKSPLLSQYLNEYKKNNPTELLIPPPPGQRGEITGKALSIASTSQECTTIIHNWANAVYQSWHDYHPLVSVIADGFLSSKY